MDEKRKKKAVMALSRATYKSFIIYEVPRGFGIFIGAWFLTFDMLQKATSFIDGWFELNN